MTRRIAATIAAAAAAVALGGTADAHAATYYNLVNTKLGLALSGTVLGGVTLAPPNPNDERQQFKRLYVQNGFNSTSSLLKRRFSACLYAPSANGSLSIGTCLNDSSNQRNRWSRVPTWGAGRGEGLHNEGVHQTVLGLCLFDSCGPMMYPFTSNPDPLRPYTDWEWRPAVVAA